jgi:hypothetical protein
MFSYQNKVVGIQIRNQNTVSDLYDVLINDAYVGSTTGSGIYDGMNLIGSDNTSLSFPQVVSGEIPNIITYDLNGFRYASYNEGSPFPGYYYLEDTHLLIYNNRWEFRDSGNALEATGGSDISNPFGYYSGDNQDVYIYPERPNLISWYYEGEFSTGSGAANNINPNYPQYATYDISSGAEFFQLTDDNTSANQWELIGSSTTFGPSSFEDPYYVYSGFPGFGGDSYFTLTVSPFGESPESGENEIPTYHFSNLLLDTGSNQICFTDSITGGISTVVHKIDLYDISGSTLINPISVAPWTTTTRTISGWSTSYSGTESRWSIGSGGFELDFRVESNSTCGGDNDQQQFATASTNIMLVPSGSLSFDYEIASEVEVYNAGYDMTSFRIAVDGDVLQSDMLESTQTGGAPCSFESVSTSGSFSYTNNTASPVTASIAIDFDTRDGVANVASGIGTNLKINNFQTTSTTFDIGSDKSCYVFDLLYPTRDPIQVCETYPVFDVDTGNLNQIFTGSGVHLQKDVTFFFDILDQQLNAISSNQQFVENPLVSGCVFDVVNIDGTTALENFFTGKYSRSVTVTASDNENIFGTYQKDFGVRCKLPNTFDGSIFTGVFLAYGNIPHILDIAPNYVEFSGAQQATESFDAAIVLQNDLKFTQMDRYDVYALTGSGSAVDELTYLNPTAQQGYLLSQSAINVSDAYTLRINKGELEQNTPYYFTVVPYGALGSGKSFVFGPTTFVPKPIDLTFPQADVSGVNIYYGSGFSRTEYRTGFFTGDESVLHEFSSGDFSSVKYFVELYGSGIRQLSELRGVLNTTGLYLIKEGINDVSTDYQLVDLLTGQQCGLYASGTGYAGYTYKLQATML